MIYYRMLIQDNEDKREEYFTDLLQNMEYYRNTSHQIISIELVDVKEFDPTFSYAGKFNCYHRLVKE